MIVQLYKELMKVYTNQINMYEGSIAVVEDKDKDHAAGLQIAHSFILCRHQAYKTHTENKTIFIYNHDWVEVAWG
jgi:hypothetical protein